MVPSARTGRHPEAGLPMMRKIEVDRNRVLWFLWILWLYCALLILVVVGGGGIIINLLY